MLIQTNDLMVNFEDIQALTISNDYVKGVSTIKGALYLKGRQDWIPLDPLTFDDLWHIIMGMEGRLHE